MKENTGEGERIGSIAKRKQWQTQATPPDSPSGGLNETLPPNRKGKNRASQRNSREMRTIKSNLRNAPKEKIKIYQRNISADLTADPGKREEHTVWITNNHRSKVLHGRNSSSPSVKKTPRLHNILMRIYWQKTKCRTTSQILCKISLFFVFLSKKIQENHWLMNKTKHCGLTYNMLKAKESSPKLLQVILQVWSLTSKTQ